jgi:CPA2 family monovalent cation:H+ antiporter-2
MDNFAQILLLLGATVAVVVGFLRLRIPSSLGYLLVGVMLGPHTIGPTVDLDQMQTLAEFGIVFLLFTIGLNFSLPQLHALRHQVLLLGTGQVLFTTAAVGLIGWLAGLPAIAAFVVGAVFAQSSTTIIGKQLTEQAEDNSRHGRLGLAMSVFQDITAVPFVVVIPVLGLAAGAGVIAGELAWAMAKAALALTLVFFVGRWLLRPLFHLVTRHRSAEVFTLTVLLVALLAAWTTHRLGLSLAFGAFLAGMMLGETEFRHQVESSIRPFRDVLLGLFFIGIGMLFEPAVMPQVWHWALLGAALMLLSKTLLVALIVRQSGIDTLTAWRTGLLLSVGGEFGFALLAIALGAQAIDAHLGQIVLVSVLFSMIAGPVLIRYNHAIANLIVSRFTSGEAVADTPGLEVEDTAHLRNHVIICGYGRIGQSVGHFLEEEHIPFIAVDLDVTLVRQAHAAGEPVFYGDAGEHAMLDGLGLAHARLVVIAHNDLAAALRILTYLRAARPNLPVMVRTRDESHTEQLQACGAVEVVPETLEAGLMIASQALLLLDVPLARVMRRIQEQRSARYPLMHEFYQGDALSGDANETDMHRLRSIGISAGSRALGRTLREIDLAGVSVTALVRAGVRQYSPPPDTRLELDDEIVIYGTQANLRRAEMAVNH